MIDVNKISTGDSVFWLDNELCVLEHTYIGNIGSIGIVSGEITPPDYSGKFPIGSCPLIDHSISAKIKVLVDANEPYSPFPVCFVDVKNLYRTKQEAEEVMYKSTL